MRPSLQFSVSWSISGFLRLDTVDISDRIVLHCGERGRPVRVDVAQHLWSPRIRCHWCLPLPAGITDTITDPDGCPRSGEKCSH